MEAEWRALLFAAQLAAEKRIATPIFIGDALAVIQQAGGKARTPPALREFHQLWLAIAPHLGAYALRHVKRQQNLAGIALAQLHPRG